jgi:hypothetical protein
MKLSQQDLVVLLEKAWDNIEAVISELPDNDEDDNPLMYLTNSVGDIQDAINLLYEVNNG